MTVNWTGHKVRVVILLAALCPLGALAQVVITQQPQSRNLPTGATLSWGVFTLDTAGSSFDTLLAVYTGDAVGSLTLVASNDDNITCDDSTHGFHTSRVRFNARGGTVYHIAVDGLSGTAGDIVLSWRLNLLEDLLPV